MFVAFYSVSLIVFATFLFLKDEYRSHKNILTLVFVYSTDSKVSNHKTIFDMVIFYLQYLFWAFEEKAYFYISIS